jgi:hypothetical protein
MFGLELFETLHHVTRKTHVIEHSFQFLGERVSPGDFEMSKGCQHTGLGTYDSTLSLATMFRSASSETLRPLSSRFAK